MTLRSECSIRSGGAPHDRVRCTGVSVANEVRA